MSPSSQVPHHQQWSNNSLISGRELIKNPGRPPIPSLCTGIRSPEPLNLPGRSQRHPQAQPLVAQGGAAPPWGSKHMTCYPTHRSATLRDKCSCHLHPMQEDVKAGDLPAVTESKVARARFEPRSV